MQFDMGLTSKEYNALRKLADGEPINRGRDWLKTSHLRVQDGIGWPHLTEHMTPTVWGGTLDGILGLCAAGCSRFEPIVADSLAWLLNQQRSDGGFGSREMGYSSTESTAWVVYMLKQIGFDFADPRVTKAVQFLETCVQSNGDVGTSPGETPRIYPAAVVLLALHGISDRAQIVAMNLKDAHNGSVGGWGNLRTSIPVPAKTAQVLFALLSAGYLHKDEAITRSSVEFILSRQQVNGDWKNHTETWYSKHQQHIPLVCHDHTINWCIKSLLAAGLSSTNPALARAIAFIIESQQPSGIWLFEEEDESEHIWCNSGAIVTLALARKDLVNRIVNGDVTMPPPNAVIKDRSITAICRKFVKTAMSNSSNIAIAIIAVFVFRQYIYDFIKATIDYVSVFIDQKIPDVVIGVVGNTAYFILTIAVSIIISAVKSRGRKT